LPGGASAFIHSAIPGAVSGALVYSASRGVSAYYKKQIALLFRRFS
jgi:hypothetical protein